ncbi:MAG: CoA pyrophosphatase, partial [Chloroflexi bacterium]|nr:CoA pyrophosphatase [Chloroflexota bacterium]
VLLNKRSNHVEHHKGEISFPGGAKDQEDNTLRDTAIRETHEEMGILPEDIEILGELDDVATRSRFLMRPYVGTIPYPYDFKPFEAEVAEVIEVPISHLLDEENHRDETRIVDGELSYSPSYAYNGHVVFGATARVLKQFLELLETAPDKEALWKKKQP